MIKLVALLAACAASASASAAISWNFSAGGNNSSNTFGNTRGYSAGGVDVAASAWANTSGTSNTILNTAYVGSFSGSGLGVTNRDGATTASPAGNGTDAGEGLGSTGEHATDNNDRVDSLLFSFSESVNLSHITIGWPDSPTSLDTDFTVLAYTGAGAPTLASKTYGGATGLQASGWTLIGHFANAVSDQLTSIANSTFSSYWLISAYNPSIDNRSCNSYDTSYLYTCGNDYFKLLALKGDKQQPPPPPPPPGDTSGVPEPGTLALLAATGIGLGLRRRKAR